MKRKSEPIPLTRWFKIRGDDMSPNYFYYNYIKNMIEFLVDEPEDYYHIGSVKWKRYKTKINIGCSKLTKKISKKDNNIYKRLKENINNKFNKKQIPLLKSNLQKCIRRSKEGKSLNTGLTLLCLDENELLRRLPIIILEDALLVENYTFLIWLMCAVSKGFDLNDILVNKILNIIRDIALTEYRDKYENEEVKEFNLKKIKALNKKKVNILWSIQLRRSYGGMRGDMNMLEFFSIKWYERFKEGIDYLKNDNKPLLKNVNIIKYNDIVLSSVDFHCTNILYLINKLHEDIEEYKLKKAIWFYRSSITNKIYLYEEDNNKEEKKLYNLIWRIIKEDVKTCSKKILNKIYFKKV
jgi:hypothetical protein